MTYSTGSGTYLDLMAAVLAHAVADGWTTSGGTWPISKGKVRGVDWSTTTRAANDFSTGVAVGFTERIIRLAIGTSPANATANAALTSACLIPCMNFNIVDWHIFSDPGVGKPDYIHVVTRYSNGVFSDIFNHFSFGELDKGGMTHSGAAYAASHARRGYPAIAAGTGTATWQSYDWNCAGIPNWPAHFGGNSRGLRGGQNRQGATEQHLLIILDPVTPCVPATGGWLQPDVLGTGGDLLDTLTTSSGTITTYANLLTSATSIGMVCQPGFLPAQPYTGGVSLQSIPAILLSGTGGTSPAMFIGVFPGVRFCTMQSYNPRDEITYGADTWKLMPVLRKTPDAQQGQSLIVSSAEIGYAYKKVA